MGTHPIRAALTMATTKVDLARVVTERGANTARPGAIGPAPQMSPPAPAAKSGFLRGLAPGPQPLVPWAPIGGSHRAPDPLGTFPDINFIVDVGSHDGVDIASGGACCAQFAGTFEPRHIARGKRGRNGRR
jgi:hypothetical protein